MITQTFRASLGLLATRRFGVFWFASLLSSIGTWAQQVAEPWLLLTLGASSFVIGLDSFAMNAPVLLLTLTGGVLADRSDRRRVILVFQSIQMLCPTGIVLLLIAGGIRPWMIVALSVVVGVTDALSMPSFQSIVPSIVKREEIATGLALNSTQFSLSRILGPSIAGVLMTSVGVVSCFVLSAISYLPFIGVALWILPRRVREPAALDAPHAWRHFAGIGEVFRQSHLRRTLLTVLATSVLCGPLITFTPVLVKVAFQGSAAHFSAAVASFGAGGLLGATGLLGVPSRVDRRRLTSAFAVALAAALILIALDPWFWVLLLLLMVAGASLAITNTTANSILQSAADAHLLGRTVSLYMLAVRGGLAAGALLTGASVGLLGVQHALLVNGVVALLAQAALAVSWMRVHAPDAIA